MVKLRNTVRTAAGTKFLLNGEIHEIDKDGFCADLSKDESTKLLKMAAWTSDLKSGKSGGKSKSGISLLNSAGDVVATTEKEPEPSEDESTGDSTDDAWPDPTEDMELAYLREMADAYEVKYGPRTGNPRLCKDIMAAMYPQE